MEPVAVDLETCRFAPGLMAPMIVCASTYHPADGARIWTTDQLPAMFERVLSDPAPILGHGFSFDACCILEWYPQLRHILWAKYEQDGIIDSLTTERIIEISTGVRGKLALDELARRYGIQVHKSVVRKDFGRYLGQPLSEYTAEHKRYVIGDSAELHRLNQRQLNRGIVSRKDLGDLCRGDLWLRLSSNWGIRTDPTRVEELERSTQEDVDELTEVAQEWGGMRRTRPADPSKWFSRDMGAIKRRVVAAYGWEHAPKTDSWDAGLDRNGKQTDPRGIPGKIPHLIWPDKYKDAPDFDPLWGISASSTALDESGDPILEAMSHLGQMLAVRNKDVKMLKQGVHTPIHTRYGYAATTRTTSSAPNIQNFRRKAGIRECLQPREGCVYLASDYPGLESFTLAQVCVWKLGRRAMLDTLNAGRDLHAQVGASILNCSYEEIQARRKAGDKAAEDARQTGKMGNFGLTGYMTDPDTFALYVNLGCGLKGAERWDAARATEAMAAWRKGAHDQVAFLKYVDTLKNKIGLYDVEIPGTQIVRRGCTRTAGANTHFQGLGATVARRAGWLLAKAQYIDRTHPGRTALFVHDEFVTEVRVEDVEQAARVQEACMLQAVDEICPDVRLHSEANEGIVKDALMLDSAAMWHYSKKAKHARDEKGRLQICRV